MTAVDVEHGVRDEGRWAPALRLLARVGDAVLTPARGVWWLSGLAAATLVQSVRPGTWRRTVRAEFVRQMTQTGPAALPAVIVVGALVGLGLVLQALYWLGLFGQSDVVGQLIVLVLVRELSPLIVGLLVIGRSASVMLVDLVAIRASGKLESLDAMGVDPFHLLVLPRVLALALSSVCLNVVFIASTMVLGHLGARVFGLANRSFGDFVHDVLANMGIAEFSIVVVKPLLIGFAVGLIACGMALRSRYGTRALLPRGFVASMAVTLLISGAVSTVL